MCRFDIKTLRISSEYPDGGVPCWISAEVKSGYYTKHTHLFLFIHTQAPTTLHLVGGPGIILWQIDLPTCYNVDHSSSSPPALSSGITDESLSPGCNLTTQTMADLDQLKEDMAGLEAWLTALNTCNKELIDQVKDLTTATDIQPQPVNIEALLLNKFAGTDDKDVVQCSSLQNLRSHQFML